MVHLDFCRHPEGGSAYISAKRESPRSANSRCQRSLFAEVDAQRGGHDQQCLEQGSSGDPHPPLGSNLVAYATETCAEKEGEKRSEGLTVGDFEAKVARMGGEEAGNGEGELYKSTGFGRGRSARSGREIGAEIAHFGIQARCSMPVGYQKVRSLLLVICM
jgi:hypothetical protein